MIYFGFYFNVKDAIPTNPVEASLPSRTARPFAFLLPRLTCVPATSPLGQGLQFLTALISGAAHRRGGGGGGEGGGSKKSESGS